MMAGLDGLSGDWEMLKFVVLVWGQQLEITLQLKQKNLRDMDLTLWRPWDIIKMFFRGDVNSWK